MSETKMYSVLDKWTDLDKENIVDFTSIDGVVTEARLNGVPVGGGGGGAVVKTAVVETPIGYNIFVFSADAISFNNMLYNIDVKAKTGIPGIPIDPSYKVLILAEEVDTISGEYESITFDEDSWYKINGDVTVTPRSGD